MARSLALVAAVAAAVLPMVAFAFHDCVQPRSLHRRPAGVPASSATDTCAGGLCVGMHGGPHEGGPSSYPAGNASVGFTYVHSTMTVPA